MPWKQHENDFMMTEEIMSRGVSVPIDESAKYLEKTFARNDREQRCVRQRAIQEDGTLT